MAQLTIDAANSLYYEYTEPDSASATFVFFNPLTGDTGMWNASIVPALHEAGFGTLVYNMRGQKDSPFESGITLDQNLIVDDAIRLLEAVKPINPVFVGLSIGGLYAANAALRGANCDKLVLINTLRRDGPRLQWINDAVVRMSEVGGPALMRDIMSPLIMNEGWLAENRSDCLGSASYEPIDTDSGVYNLLSSARSSNWDVPYEQLTMPVLCITGKHDRVFRDPDDIASYLSRLPNATHLEFDNAGHMVPVEQPEAFLDALKQFAV
jgi:pimeloyl-ACP methyl ester carboxylesterase